ncbi:nuclear pore complex protein NUP205-like [Rosa rugosa]|uniref:nuclear pore complex protein NUP205-like n=1 Tax=Rosa rugosa TaxID=74645 RepID=UPI002B401F26|nr:nuclear pore complex protein NUP205-like [Rosa rugosa]
MCNAYLQKLITYSPASYSPTCQRQGQRIKELKERATSVLSPCCLVGSHELSHDSNQTAQASESGPLPFVSLLEFVSGIYRKEPEQLSGNDALWTFVNFAGEDDTNFQTLVALLNMLSTLASSQEGAATVWELLQGKVFRSVGWSTLFDSLSIYKEKF